MTKTDIEILGAIVLFLILTYLNHKYEWRLGDRFSEMKKMISRYFGKAS